MPQQTIRSMCTSQPAGRSIVGCRQGVIAETGGADGSRLRRQQHHWLDRWRVLCRRAAANVIGIERAAAIPPEVFNAAPLPLHSRSQQSYQMLISYLRGMIFA